jgi:hypothetical protein
MKDKKIFKKWWFWAIVVVIMLGAVGSLGQSDKDNTADTTNNSPSASNSTSTLPKLSADDYRNKEGLVVYKDLKTKGYKVDAEFENQALTDINGKASDLFEPLDPDKADDKQSVDAFVVSNLLQDGDSVTLTIAKSSN